MNKKNLIIAILLSGLFFNVLLFANGGKESQNVSGDRDVACNVCTTVEIIYLNHGPIRKVVADIENLLEAYGEKIQLIHYTFSSPEGKSFAESKKLDGHIPLAVYIDGAMGFTVDNRSVEFISFPQGGGTGFVEDGAWSIEDLKLVLDRIQGQS
jgi:hypothetical protein